MPAGVYRRRQYRPVRRRWIGTKPPSALVANKRLLLTTERRDRRRYRRNKSFVKIARPSRAVQYDEPTPLAGFAAAPETAEPFFLFAESPAHRGIQITPRRRRRRGEQPRFTTRRARPAAGFNLTATGGTATAAGGVAALTVTAAAVTGAATAAGGTVSLAVGLVASGGIATATGTAPALAWTYTASAGAATATGGTVNVSIVSAVRAVGGRAFQVFPSRRRLLRRRAPRIFVCGGKRPSGPVSLVAANGTATASGGEVLLGVGTPPDTAPSLGGSFDQTSTGGIVNDEATGAITNASVRAGVVRDHVRAGTVGTRRRGGSVREPSRGGVVTFPSRGGRHDEAATGGTVL